MRDASGTFFYVCLCWAEGVMGMAWKEQYGRSSMEGAVWEVLVRKKLEDMEGMDGIPCKDTTFL